MLSKLFICFLNKFENQAIHCYLFVLKIRQYFAEDKVSYHFVRKSCTFTWHLGPLYLHSQELWTFLFKLIEGQTLKLLFSLISIGFGVEVHNLMWIICIPLVPLPFLHIHGQAIPLDELLLLLSSCLHILGPHPRLKTTLVPKYRRLASLLDQK